MPHRQKSVLYVEGTDDRHVVRHLLRRHGTDSSEVEIKAVEGKDALFGAIRTAVRTPTGRSVGFVLDADQAPQDRWQAVRSRLDAVGLNLPSDIPFAGFVGEAERYRVRVGVWLMPDNRQAGALEKFLEGLVGSGDALFARAEASTTIAREKGAAFPDGKRRKAVPHSWLAWQEKPGLPYGSALNAHYFGHDSSAALAFVKWFEQVFLRS